MSNMQKSMHLESFICYMKHGQLVSLYLHTCKVKKQSVWQPCKTWLLLTSEPALGCQWTTQKLKANPWDKTSNTQDYPGEYTEP